MADFPSAVNPPGGVNYAAPLMNFSNFSNWAADDPYKKIFDQQAQQLNQQRLTQGQQAIDLTKVFQQGLPQKDGQIDYQAAAQMLAKFGDVGNAVTLLNQAPPPMSPLLGGGQAAGAAVGGAPAGGAAPASVQARPLPPPSGGSPRGDSGSGSITDIVTDRLPSQNMTTGQTILKIADVMGVDPNATLTPGQLKRAQGLLQKYAPEIAGQGAPAASFDSRFAVAGGGDSGDLPPSANAVSPAPRVTAAPAAGGGAGQPQPGQAVAPQGAPVAAPAGPQGAPGMGPGPQPQGPIVPQVPLPKGFAPGQEQQAILALRQEAARLSAYPKAAGQVAELNNYASRIEAAIQPLQVGPNTTLVDPRTRQTVYQGPGAQALSASGAGGGPTLEADAELYRQTGKLPPNMGRGMQGSAEAKAIRNRAVEQELAAGGDPGTWAPRWQKFQAQATGQRVLENRAVGLTLAENEASSLIPRVRDVASKVSKTEYPSINKLINAAQKGTGGTDVIKLGIAIESLIPVYARVLKPVGQIGVSDTATAHDLLDKAWSNGQINAALDQMEVELKSARSALNKTMKEFGTEEKSGKDSGGSSGSGSKAAPNTTPSGFSWSVVQ